MIEFNEPICLEASFECMKEAGAKGKLSGDGDFTLACSRWLEENLHAQKALLTVSGTAALEMAARLAGIEPGDEVILPSFTFSSTANAFIGLGAKLVFVDIRPDTMNIDEALIEDAITDKTKAICVVHYGGVGCEMDTIMRIAHEHGLTVIEDAAHAPLATYKDMPLGTIGDFGCLSFHETKNYSMGEGGAVLISDLESNEPAEILREKGTDRSKFFRGQVDKYTWVDYGSSYLPSELNAAFLWPQLENAHEINDERLARWNQYYEELEPLAISGKIGLPYIPDGCKHNAHLFYIKCSDLAERSALIEHLAHNGVRAVFHYVPLHSAPAGLKYGRFNGEDIYTTKESERLLRLPMYFGLSPEEVSTVTRAIRSFYG